MGRARSIAARLLPWLRRNSSETPHLGLGRRGEDAAARHLRALGFKVLRRNFRSPGGEGEIDLVCRDGDVLVFVEVKTRSGEFFGRPADAVDERRRRRMARAALAWLRLLDMPDIVFRFDVVEVVGADIRHIENAFPLPEPFHY